MITEQIFISFPEACRKRVTNIINFLISHHFKVYFDPEKRLLGAKFMEDLQFEINRSQLFIIFIAKQRNPKGVINAELDWIKAAEKKLHTTPHIILVLLDQMSTAEMEQYVDKWLLNMEITTIEYVKGHTRKAKEALLNTLNTWSAQFETLPSSITPTTLEKHKRDLPSKRVLAKWVQKNFSSRLVQDGPVFIGPGTTIHEAWSYCLRDLYISNDLQTQLFTNNGLITHSEGMQRRALKAHIPMKKVGTSYLKEYAAYRCVKPGRDFPQVDFSLISVSGYRVSGNTFNLRVCWDELRGTFKEVFLKTKREIVIIAAGRKIIDSEGSAFINLLPLMRKNSSLRKKWLTLAIDTQIPREARAEFDERIKQLSDTLGKYKKDTHYPVIYWRVRL